MLLPPSVDGVKTERSSHTSSLKGSYDKIQNGEYSANSKRGQPLAK